MQYKRWLARTGTATKFQQYRTDSQDLHEDGNTNSTHSESEDEELNQELIDWLTEWEKKEELITRGVRLEAVT